MNAPIPKDPAGHLTMFVADRSKTLVAIYRAVRICKTTGEEITFTVSYGTKILTIEITPGDYYTTASERIVEAAKEMERTIAREKQAAINLQAYWDSTNQKGYGILSK